MRTSGILLAISSLNSKYGVGDFGKEAYKFVDIIQKTGFTIWQLLPLNPLGYGNSPYQPYSSQAGDEIYISPDLLYEQGLLKKKPKTLENNDRVDYEKARKLKAEILKEAFKNFKKDKDYEEFIKFDFVYKYAVFLTLKKANNLNIWNKWDKEQKNWIIDKKLDLSKYNEGIEYEMFVQYIFYKQWTDLKKYANSKGIRIMGDIPFYVGLDSLDVWENQKSFLLNKNGNPKFIAGVPPDYFSKNGQRWGNPIYDWKYLKENDYDFWIKRIEYNSKLYDILRIDHFRAFDTYWQVNARNKTAKAGEWIEAPGYEVFDLIKKKFPKLEIVAEDLGGLRKEVLQLRDHYNLKGMKILLFSLDPNEGNNNFSDKKNMIIYTGTHDNQTAMGFFESQDQKTKDYIIKLFKEHNYDTQNIANGFLEMTFDSIADYAIVPVQDILGLDDSARMNTPSTLNNINWSFKLNSMEKLEEKTDYLHKLLKKTKRI
ncbi:4-alpha-glucanotransferase [Peptoanaerobacter stomatis]|uniref:4-alpha-glucanotransferase n=1 Tax=Peptoanaerobacter stomatis TaxID=796937 RepID=G9WXB6_9FIRM|nr:4-alpha-glucanotransferase [Peptoanaerobacter stomatis]EHL16763.1 4-alpha-glucanotransferase [Peptoanaerobacter stomatis]